VNVNNEFVLSAPMEESWKAMLALKGMTVAARERYQLYVVLALA
jgi:hypothetical protein